MNKWLGLTQNDTDSCILDLLDIAPSVQQGLLIATEPPQNEITLIDRTTIDIFGYELEDIISDEAISGELHDSLLARSLVENEGLWRSLAGK